MADRQLEFVLTLRDEATKNWEKFKGQVIDGSLEVQKTVTGTGTAMAEGYNLGSKAAAQHIGILEKAKQAIRGHRQEQRMQNFAFNEINKTVGALAVAMMALDGVSGDNKGMKKNVDAVKQGLFTFQGLSFAMSAVPYGQFIAGAIGAGVAVLQLARGSVEVVDTLKLQKEALDALSGAYEKWSGKLKGSDEANRAVSAEEAGLLNARRVALDAYFESQKTGQTVQLDVTKYTEDQVAAMQDEINKATERTRVYKTLSSEQQKDFVDNAARLKELIALQTAASGASVVTPTSGILSPEAKKARAEAEAKTNLDILKRMISDQVRMDQDYDKYVEDSLRRQEENYEKFYEKISDMADKTWEAVEKSQVAYVDKLGKLRIDDLTGQEKIDAEKLAALDEFNKQYFDSVEDALYALDVLQNHFTQKSENNRLQSIQRAYEQYAQFGQQAINLLTQASNRRYDAELDGIQTAKEAELGRIDAALENDKLSADQRKKLEAEKAAVTKKYDDEARAVKKKQWEADREGRLFMAIIDTAAAVVKALPNIPLALIAGAMGAAQVAIIASQSAPKFRTGTGAAGFTVPQGYNNDNFPVLVSSGEKVHVTPRGQAGGGGATLVFNFNAPVSDEEFVYQSIVKRLRATGMSIDRTFRNPNLMALGTR